MEEGFGLRLVAIGRRFGGRELGLCFLLLFKEGGVSLSSPNDVTELTYEVTFIGFPSSTKPE